MLSFRYQLVLVHLLSTVVIVGCAALAGWWQLSRSVHGQLDAALLALAETEVGMLAGGKGQPIRVHEAPVGTAPPSLIRLDRLVQIIDAQGNVLAHSANLGMAQLPAPPALLAKLAVGQIVFETLPHVSEEPLRMVSIPTLVGDRVLAVQVAGSLDDANNLLASATILFAGMAVALLVAVAIAGAVLTRRVFRAIDDVNHQARRIGEISLNERLPHPGTDDKLGGLVDTLNDMLDRLERAFDLQRRFTADASHELRSPLSRLRMEIEVTLRRPRDTLEYVSTLRSCMEEVERLTLLIEGLLLLARLDAGQEYSPIKSISLNILAEQTIHRLEPLACERQVRLVLDTELPATVMVADGSVSLVLTNLVDNAVKFSPPGGQVTIQLSTECGEAVIRVTDQGPGIAVHELPFLFDRFYRGVSARAGAIEGVGLGLALSQAVACACGGRIDASNVPGSGALFVARFPLMMLSSASEVSF